MAELTPLSYKGGFQPKTLVFETLVTLDEDGRIAPGLASRWEILNSGRELRFELRAGAQHHDGTPVTAEDVRIHFQRWIGLPEHAWLGASERIRAVVAESERSLRIELIEPYALLPELCAINPCAIQAPAAIDGSGEFVRPLGSGPFRYVEAVGPARHRFELVASSGRYVDLVAFDSSSPRSTLEALLAGDVDLIVDGWYEHVPRERVIELQGRSDLAVFEGPGSSVHYLSFRLAGPTARREVRAAVAAAVDRAELIEDVEHGHADPADAWAASTVRTWPRGAIGGSNGTVPEVPLRLLVHASEPREVGIATALARQGARAGLTIEVDAASDDAYPERLASQTWDLRLEHTWGVPYDPFLSLRARFLPPSRHPTATDDRFFGVDPRVTALVRRASRIPEEVERTPVYAEIQRLLDDEVLIVPLLVPRRLGVARADRATPVALTHDLYRTPLEALAR